MNEPSEPCPDCGGTGARCVCGTEKLAVLFDTETTGAEEGAQIIESAMGFIDTDAPPMEARITHIRVQRYCPSVPIELGALATHHIIARDVENCPPSTSFTLPPNVVLLVGHNINFDWKMAGRPKVKRICTLALARKVWPTLDSHTLGALIYFLHPHPQAQDLLRGVHSAAVDVENVLRVLAALCVELKPSSWNELWKMSEEARVPTVMAFGKHQGDAIVDLPTDYRNWILKQGPDMDPYLKVAVRRSFGWSANLPTDDEL